MDEDKPNEIAMATPLVIAVVAVKERREHNRRDESHFQKFDVVKGCRLGIRHVLVFVRVHLGHLQTGIPLTSCAVYQRLMEDRTARPL